MSGSNISHEGLNILCIDGGGARGLSALVILDEIMKRIQLLGKVDSAPHPYQCFDIIAGTGTGAVQACMLGRLRMSLHSAIEAYTNLAKDVFSERKRIGSGSFKTTKLRDALRNIIQSATGDPDEPMMDLQQTEGQCRTLVFAMSSHNMRAGIPTAFRSYSVVANEGPRCTIWETLCATMAHPDLFKTFTIGNSPLNQSFVDAGLGCNNPLTHVLSEVKALYPTRHVASITSIGTGHTRTIQIPNTSMLRHLLPIAAITAMKNIATDTERVAEEMARRFNSTKGLYFRLNVDQGMQNVEKDGWEQLSEVFAHTHAYTRLGDVNQRIDKVARAVGSRKPIVPTMQIDGEVQVDKASSNVPSIVRHCPAPTPMFTGCEPMIRKIESCITGSTMERKVCVLHGLGGAGKTQTALKVIERTYDQWKEVVYVDASTQESIESTLKDTAVTKKVGSTYQDTLQWLGSNREPWLVIFDNADEPSLPIRSYFPGGNHGSIIITTRLSGMVALSNGPHSDCNLSSMDPEDALALLLKLARKQGPELLPGEMDSAKALLQDFDHFALAIVHAGSFIGHSPHMSITEYRSLFMERQQQMLEAYSKFPAAVKADGYKHTVYTAWRMCYELLRPQARALLWLIGFLHHTGITIDIFRRAATNIGSYKPTLPTTPLEDLALRELQKILCSFLSINRHWDSLLFTQTINEITSRSLLEYDHINQSYRIHVLVQSWVRTIIPWEPSLVVECVRTLLSVSIPHDNSLESIMFCMSIGLHVDKALSGTSGEIGPNHALQFSSVYEGRGQWRQAEPLRLQVQEAHELALGSDHPDTLTNMQDLARIYAQLNRLEEARGIMVQVLDTRKRVLGNDHNLTLSAMNSLAHIYSQLNLLNEARDLYAQVLETQKRIWGTNDPDTLTVMQGLARTYLQLGQLEEARDLMVQVLDLRKRVLGNDHPRTLSTMHNLAYTYLQLDRSGEAKDLFVQVLGIQKRILGNDHPNTLMTMRELATTYLMLGLWEEAEKLHIDLDKYVQVFGENDVWTRAARDMLWEVQGYRERQAGGSS